MIRVVSFLKDKALQQLANDLKNMPWGRGVQVLALKRGAIHFVTVWVFHGEMLWGDPWQWYMFLTFEHSNGGYALKPPTLHHQLFIGSLILILCKHMKMLKLHESTLV